MTVRYTASSGTISTIKPIGYGAHVVSIAKRVPKAVREAFEGPTFGRTEVEYDPKTRTARRVEFWDRYRP
jgi:hypothetical protein